MLTDNLFTKVESQWDLERLTEAIAEIKAREGDRTRLATIEKIVLCGLLCGYQPEDLIEQLPGESYGLVVNLTWRIHRYLEKIVTHKLNIDLPETSDILSLLTIAGYNKSIEIIPQKISSNKFPCQANSSTTDEKFASNNNNISTIELKLESATKLQRLDRNHNKLTVSKTHQPVHCPQTDILANSFLPPTIDAELLPSVSRWTTIGGMVTLGLVGIAVTLAAIVKYDVTLKADAVVRPEGEIKLVHASSEGKVKSILVRENQSVRKGDVIAYLDNAELENQKQQIATHLHQSQLQLAKIDAQINSLDKQIVAETEKSDRAIASARAELERTQIDERQEELTTQAQIEEATAELNIARQELAKAQTELQSVEANLKSTEVSLASAKTKRDRYQKILSSGAISQEQFEEAQLEVEREQQNLASQQAAVLGQKQTIQGQQQGIEVALAKLSRVRAALNSSDASIKIARQAIEREKANKNATLASYLREKEVLSQQRIEIEKQIAKERQQLQQLKREINQTALRATADGTVLQLNLRNPSQVVNSQDTIAEIAPDSTNLTVKAQVNPQDRDRLTLGQSVKLKVDACPYPDYGILSGKVTAISADTIAATDKEHKYYTAEISLSATTLNKGDRSCQLRSGMEANADIITKAETPLQFFIRQARLFTDW